MINNVISFCLFFGFTALAILAIAKRSASPDGTPGPFLQLFIIYTVCISCAVGFLHVECWPFSRWNIFSQKAPDVVYSVRVKALDNLGSEYDIDHRAWEPFSIMELYTWLDFDFAALPDGIQRRVAAYLLIKVNEGRTRALSGQPIGTFDRWLGPLTMPMHVLYRNFWEAPRLPQEPFVGLRIYREWYNVYEREGHPERVWRTAIYEFPER